MMKNINSLETQKTCQNSKVNNDRRKALTGLVATGAVLSVWHKPALHAVVLPAHAQTSTTDTDTAGTNFFATVAAASEVTASVKLLELMVQPAYALLSTNEEPLNDLSFEAEAIFQGGDNYALKIAAESTATNGKTISSSNTFIFGWEGVISGLNANASLSGTGCAQNESGRITAIGSNALTLEMSYFSKTISLELSDGSTSLPNFPLATCS